MVRKIKKIVRIKKKQKVYNFSDDTEILLSNTIYRKLFMLFVLIAAFLVVYVQVFSPTQNLVNSFNSDFQSKENLIQNGKRVKAGLVVQSKKYEEEYKIIKNTFFKRNENYEFFTLIANSAINNQLKIISMQKDGEAEQFKLPNPGSDPSAPADQLQYEYFSNFIQVRFKIDFEGSYINYMSFINDIKNENKSLAVENSIITKKENNELNIKSILSINYANSDV